MSVIWMSQGPKQQPQVTDPQGGRHGNLQSARSMGQGKPSLKGDRIQECGLVTSRVHPQGTADRGPGTLRGTGSLCGLKEEWVWGR